MTNQEGAPFYSRVPKGDSLDWLGPVPNNRHGIWFYLFRAGVLGPQFPCLGAKKVLQDARMTYSYCPYRFSDPRAAQTTCEFLYRTFEDCGYESLSRTDDPLSFATAIVAFAGGAWDSENKAEVVLWNFLHELHLHDSANHSWENGVSKSVYSPDFGMSVGGYAHFVPLLHPYASTPSRWFPAPLLVFNPHFMFRKLRSAKFFDPWKRAIRKRESDLQRGWINPKLGDHGGNSLEAPQYALTLNPVFDIGPCPFIGEARPEGITAHNMSDYPFVTKELIDMFWSNLKRR